MIRRLTIAALLVMALTSLGHSSDVIDRILSIVNGKLILQSDLEQEARMESFLAGQPTSELKPAELKTMLDRIIDRELIHEQMRGTREVSTTSPAVERRLKELRESIGKSAESDDGWRSLLSQAGLTEEAVRGHFADEVQTLRFVESRLRPQIQVDQGSIEAYYKEEFVPNLQRSGQAPVPLADVSRRIRDILVEQKLDQSLSTWLKSLRDQSDIRMLVPIEEQSAAPKSK